MTTQTRNDRRTPLYERHKQLGARMISFGGWEMPVQYAGIREEHLAVREATGLFDVSHMGEFHVVGGEAGEWLNRMVANDLRRIAPGKAQYTQLCNEAGGTIDDLIVYWLQPDRFLLVVNAGNIDKDWHWLQQHCPPAVTLEDHSDRTALLALQGPQAERILAECTDVVLDKMTSFQLAQAKVLGCTALLARTGYTGEDGFEIFLSPEDAAGVWDELLARGARPAGLGARDTLRLEAAFPLYGHELDEQTSPLEAGLGWSVKLDKAEFLGREALLRQRQEGLKKRLVGLKMRDKAIARQGYAVLKDSKVEGTVTSGTLAPYLGYPVAMAFVAPYLAEGGNWPVDVQIRQQTHPADTIKLPFYRRKPA